MRAGALGAFWEARSRRERLILAWGSIAALALAGYGALWRPMTADLARLEGELPRLRAQFAQVKQVGEEIARLRAAAPAGAIERAQLPGLIARSAAAHQLERASTAAARDGQRVKVTLERASFGAWLGWVDELHRGHRVVLVESRVGALDAPGLVRIEAEFALATEAK